jgi:hypothetical protein
VEADAMQSLEAVISLMVFLMMASAMVFPAMKQGPSDDSLYRLQLADDAWRVLYLRGGLTGLNDQKRAIVETDMQEMGRQTSLCFFISGIEFTNCRDQEQHGRLASISRLVFIDGEARRVAFSIAK